MPITLIRHQNMMRLIVKSYSLVMTQMNYISIGLKTYKELNTKRGNT